MQRDVATFSLRGLAGASTCYAWTEVGSTGRVAHHRVVLHTGPVLSPGDAIRASLLREPPEQASAPWSASRTPDDLTPPDDARRGAAPSARSRWDERFRPSPS